jgi:hypothetical protein
VKRFCADDSAATSVKVGYRQASYTEKPTSKAGGLFAFIGHFFSTAVPCFSIKAHQVILVGFFAFGRSVAGW